MDDRRGVGMTEGAWNDSLTAGDMCGPLIKHKSTLIKTKSTLIKTKSPLTKPKSKQKGN